MTAAKVTCEERIAHAEAMKDIRIGGLESELRLTQSTLHEYVHHGHVVRHLNLVALRPPRTPDGEPLLYRCARCGWMPTVDRGPDWTISPIHTNWYSNVGWRFASQRRAEEEAALAASAAVARPWWRRLGSGDG